MTNNDWSCLLGSDMERFICAPWGSWRNMAADAMGAWEWFGERDSAGQPCRWRMRYRCYNHDEHTRQIDKPSALVPYEWTTDWSSHVDDDCPECGKTYTPYTVEDLLDDREICPINMEDDDDE